MRTLQLILGSILLGLGACGGAGKDDGRLRLAFVTNCAVPFWAIAESGCDAARIEFDVDVSVHMPPNGTVEEQTKILEDLVAKGVDGIAVSPKNAANMTGLLNRVAERTLLITHDSDAPASKRLCYIGVDNYEAGRMCGAMIKRALPGGGPVVLFIGNLDQDNAQRRRQGLIDELFDRPYVEGRFDPQDAELQVGGWEIRATFTDDFDSQKTKSAAQDALTRWDDIKCMVGLFAFEPPVLVKVVEEAGRLDDIVIAAFDEQDDTLQAILDGKVCGTIVQNPYEYGRQSIGMLSQLARASVGEERAGRLPQDGFVNIPAREISKNNVEQFWQDLKQKTGAK
jgi:ribose transport system substrate-binding protein